MIAVIWRCSPKGVEWLGKGMLVWEFKSKLLWVLVALELCEGEMSAVGEMFR